MSIYTRSYTAWADFPTTTTPATASKLQNIDNGVAAANIVYNVQSPAFGAAGDGVTDDSAAIQAAIDAVPSGGGIVFIPAGVYIVNTTLAVKDRHNVWIKGAGAQHNVYFSGATSTYGTVLKRGSGGSTVLSIGATSSATATEAWRGLCVSDLAIDSNSLADYGLKITSVYGGTFENLHLRNALTASLYTTTVNTSGVGDTQLCNFNLITVRQAEATSGNGVKLDSGAAGYGNTSGCNFHNMLIYHQQGVGLTLQDADSNRFIGLTCNATGAGNGIELKGSGTAFTGHARSNTFIHVESANAIVSRGTALTQPAVNNVMYRSSESGIGTVTVETGSTLAIHDMGNTHYGTQSFGADYSTGTWSTGALKMPNAVALMASAASAASSNQTLIANNSSNEVVLGAANAGNVVIPSGTSMRFGQASHMQIASVSGTKIGTSTTDKIGFWSATPVVRPSAYTPTNVTTDRSYDANATSIDELADVLGTLIADLQSVGLIG